MILPTIDPNAPVPVVPAPQTLEHDDALRYRFLRDNWHSTIDDVKLIDWLQANRLRYGGLTRALDLAISGSQSMFAAL